MQLEEGLDTGPVYGCVRVEIGPEETADELRERLVSAGTELLVRSLDEGLGEPSPQEGEPTYAAKLEPAELQLDWTRPTVEVHRLVRLGRAWTTVRGHRLKVRRARRCPPGERIDGPPGTIAGTRVATADGCVELVEVQPEGRSVQSAADWARGARLPSGTVAGTN
jgi:methionyl-tRNA formyltransferase